MYFTRKKKGLAKEDEMIQRREVEMIYTNWMDKA